MVNDVNDAIVAIDVDLLKSGHSVQLDVIYIIARERISRTKAKLSPTIKGYIS